MTCDMCKKEFKGKHKTCSSCFKLLKEEETNSLKKENDFLKKTLNSFSTLVDNSSDEEVQCESREHADARIAEKRPSRADKNSSLIEEAIAEESVKAAPALDCPSDKKTKDVFVPEHKIHDRIQVCKIEEIDVFGLMCEMFVDSKVECIRSAVESFELPELVMPTPNYGGWFELIDQAITWCEKRRPGRAAFVEDEFCKSYSPPPTWNNSMFEDIVVDLEPTFPDNQNPEEPPNYYFLDEGTVCEFATAVIDQVCDVVSPIIDILNPINYVRCAIRSTRIVDARVMADYQGNIYANDSRACDLQEFQDMYQDTLTVYRYDVELFDGEDWLSVPAAYFPKISNRKRYPWYVRYFTALPEPNYKTIVLSMNMINELHHAKTCSVNIPEDSFRVMNRMFLNNPHNTFTEEALTGDRILECNFEFACMFCQNTYSPVERCAPVK